MTRRNNHNRKIFKVLGSKSDPDPLFPNVDPRIRIRIHYYGKVDPRIRIRIHFYQMWIPGSGSGSGSTSKWDGSETLRWLEACFLSFYLIFFYKLPPQISSKFLAILNPHALIKLKIIIIGLFIIVSTNNYIVSMFQFKYIAFSYSCYSSLVYILHYRSVLL